MDLIQKNIPQMPMPKDFGITDDDYRKAQDAGYFGQAARHKFELYKDAVKSWKEAVKDISAHPN